MSIWVNFRVKVKVKWHARKPIFWNSSSTREKWKAPFDIFLLEQTYLQISFSFVRQISFKTVLKCFLSTDWHLGTAQRWAIYYILVYYREYLIYICILYILQHFKKYMYIVSNIHFFLSILYIVQNLKYTMYYVSVPFPINGEQI